ncbi:hypothetical protein TL16_g09493 [Triparma laevis f. inornata]|uniref:Uncharacterized protein n=1 Tax=Triparma laevis f. inornata TaxID=1714386 RepID=A0A9W7B6S5_9STRA|nr:hypothetical protein TL16_g09493 [Triparma laevis f. inornata]
MFKRDSWQEKMVSQCKSALSVSPKRAKSVLFYSQHPDGRKDDASMHGGCPVLVKKQKWAANLWVWNAPRLGYPEAPVKADRNANGKKKQKKVAADPRAADQQDQQVHVTFKNRGNDATFKNGVLFYEESFWGNLHPGQQHSVNSFEGHIWNVKVNDKVVKTWIVGKDKVQVFVL